MARKIQINVSELERSHATKVINESSNKQYLIVGRWGLVSDSYSVYSTSGELLIEIKQKTLGTNPQFDIWYLDELIGSSLIHLSFHYSTIYIKQLNWLIVGNEIKQNYMIIKNRSRIGTVHSFNTRGDVVRIINTENQTDEPILVAIAAILNHPVTTGQLHVSKNPFKNFTPTIG
ncbi:hypothetical protein [Lentilactobacillus sp. SPB1-3]|uniref:Uncharacterized protein n=1 Tax=Lentilactobacillus terminaliae TaxID=3003483 RepID=A0ACD5DH75_9LACO|nr:hypothetical protein [Lentilactobacillus sp. SPB1-3]MCZ0976981.1 hypothetical protein [Lentilactobacillus sp. SPB1-3]